MKHTTLLALGLTLLADVLFYDHPRGWAAGLFVLVLAVTLLARAGRSRRGAMVRMLAGYAAVLAGALVWKSGVMAVALAAVALPALALASRAAWLRGPADWAGALAALACLGWTRVLRDLPRFHAPTRPVGRAARGLMRWAVPAALTAGFLALFGLANPVMAQGIEHTLEFIRGALAEWITLPSPLRVLFWTAVGVALWALLRWRPRRRSAAGPAGPPPVPGGGFSAGSIIRCLALFNVAFAAENATDFVYLWGGAALPAGMTFASYAHRGAYPLVATALLAAAFVLVTFAPHSASSRSRAARGLVFVWIAQNVVLTASAAWRLHLYVDVYGLTRLRFAAALWMLLVAGGLLLICWRILRERSNGWLLGANAAQLLAVLTACAWLDSDGLIALHNARHSREVSGSGPAFDYAYAAALGPSALPALDLVDARVTPGRHSPQRESLMAVLREQTGDWRGWTLHRWLLLRRMEDPS